MVLEPGRWNSRFDTRLVYISVYRVQGKNVELNARALQGLANIDLFTWQMIRVIYIYIAKLSGFPDVGFMVYLLHALRNVLFVFKGTVKVKLKVSKV